jgi:polysaccharide pyruvyl transferase WcaK-like protein
VRIALCGLFGGGNLGNEASLAAMIQVARERLPDAELFCICENPAAVTQRHGIEARFFNPRPFSCARGLSGPAGQLLRALLVLPGEVVSWWRVLRRMRRTDALIFPGTGVLDDFGLEPRGVPYDILRWCIGARVWRAKVHFVSIGAGPIRSRASRWLMRSAALLAHYRSYRDEESREFMESLGVDTTTDNVCPDLAFGLRPKEARAGSDARRRTPVIGFGVMSYYGWSDRPVVGEPIYQAYIAKVIACLRTLLQEGNDVRLLVGDIDVDQRALEDVVEALGGAGGGDHGGGGAVYSQSIRSVDDLLEEIALVEVVVGTRFHNVVCGLIQSRPVVSCGYAEKNRALLRTVGLDAYTQLVEDLDVGLLLRQVREVMRGRETHAKRIAVVVADNRKRVVEEIGGVFERLTPDHTQVGVPPLR